MNSSPRPRRASPDLTKLNNKVSFIKNELPPFKIFPDEKERKVWEGEHGWDGYSTVDLGEGPSERRPTGEEGLSAKSAGGVVRHYSGSSDGRSSVGKDRSTERLSPTPFPQSPSNIGLGQPSSRPIKPRSTSSSRPTVPQTYTSTPRSASMNMLSSPSTSVSSSRLGVAAHFVPPESSYTPSRGANWDEVVLPTVAKKLGLGFLAGNGSSEGEEGDLAVEWDRFGTPVKWIKGSTVRRMEGVPGGLNTSNLSKDDFILKPGLSPMSTSDPKSKTHSNPHSKIASPFNTSFDPSPDNPLHQSTRTQPSPSPSPSPLPPQTLRPKRSGGSSELVPQLRPRRSGEAIELHSFPIRTTQGHPLPLPVERPPSPPPFGNTNTHEPSPPGWDSSSTTHRGISRTISGSRGTLPRLGSIRNMSKQASGHSLPRQPSGQSLPRQGSGQSIPRQASGKSLRHQISHSSFQQVQDNTSGHGGYTFNDPRPAPTPSSSFASQSRAKGMQDGTGTGRSTRTGGGRERISAIPFGASEVGQGLPPGRPAGSTGGRVEVDDGHGKGCGCLIM